MRAEALAPPAVVAAASEADLFRYSEQSWLAALSESGAAVGLGVEARRIFRTSGGRYYVPVAAERDAILRLKGEPGTASVVTYVVARANARAMSERLGRAPTAGDLLLAHLVGREAALAILARAVTTPETSAASERPVEALAHPALFFAGTRARTAGELVGVVARMALAPRKGDVSVAAVRAHGTPPRAATVLAGARLKGSMPAEKGGTGEGAVAEVARARGR